MMTSLRKERKKKRRYSERTPIFIWMIPIKRVIKQREERLMGLTS
jgi:hypothetical protein